MEFYVAKVKRCSECIKFNEKDGGFDAKNTVSANFIKNFVR
jgi:hypothetical protein